VTGKYKTSRFCTGTVLINWLLKLLACPDGRLFYLNFGVMSFAGRAQRSGFLLSVMHIVNQD
jgi:hypothetical protein